MAEPSRAGARALFTILFVSICYYISLASASVVDFLPRNVYICLICVVAGYVGLWRVDIERLLWLTSEFLGRTRNVPWNTGLILEGSEERIIANRVQLGDFVCDAEDHKALESDKAAYQGDSWHLVLPKYYRPVITKIKYSNTGRIQLGMLGRELRKPVEPDKEFFRCDTNSNWPRVTRHDAWLIGIADALKGLVDLLPDEGYLRECDIVTDLTVTHAHSMASVRAAMCVAGSAELIIRSRAPAYGVDLFRIFKGRRVAVGHASCRIYLSERGCIWKKAELLDHYETPKGLTVEGDFNLNHGFAVSMGRNNETNNTVVNPSWQNLQGLDMVTLAQEFAALRDELGKQATDPEQYMLISHIAAAQLAADKSDGSGAMTELTKLGQFAPLGKWVLNTATAIVVPLAKAALEQYFHMPPG